VVALSASALVLVWERALNAAPLDRPLAVVAAADPARGPDLLEGLSIGRRDAELLALREETFGRMIEAVVDCPACGEALELSFDASRLDRGETAAGESHTLAAAGAEVRFRLPTTADLVAVAGEADVGRAREALLERCVIDPPAEELPVAARGAGVARMAELDPLANIELELACPACGEIGRAGFDIASFVWAELDMAARRALEDVHVIASAYGWREEDVLALSPERRRAYLELAG
jgi:predicted RNA-binding Zn-ribbon protein involved in translation (DUF1610 family)